MNSLLEAIEEQIATLMERERTLTANAKAHVAYGHTARAQEALGDIMNTRGRVAGLIMARKMIEGYVRRSRERCFNEAYQARKQRTSRLERLRARAEAHGWTIVKSGRNYDIILDDAETLRCASLGGVETEIDIADEQSAAGEV